MRQAHPRSRAQSACNHHSHCTPRRRAAWHKTHIWVCCTPCLHHPPALSHVLRCHTARTVVRRTVTQSERVRDHRLLSLGRNIRLASEHLEPCPALEPAEVNPCLLTLSGQRLDPRHVYRSWVIVVLAATVHRIHIRQSCADVKWSQKRRTT